MRIACVYRDFNLGGSLQRHSVVLVRGLAALGHEVHCYGNPATATADLGGATLHDVTPLATSRGRAGYAVECGSFAVAATRALRRDRREYDLVHVSGPAAWEHDVVTVHAVTRVEQGRWLALEGERYRAAGVRASLAPLLRPQLAVARTVERLQFRPGRCPKVLAVTEQVRDDVVRVHGVPASAVEVVPYPLTFEPLGRSQGNGLRAQLALPPDTPMLLFIGHDFARKGLREAILALRDLQPAAHLVVVGAGDSTPFVELAHGAGAAGRVHFVGGSDRPEIYFADADVFVLPTRREPWGMPLIEAMAAGVPVVTTRIAGAAGEVERAGAGIVVDEGTPGHVRHATERLLRDADLRRRMGESGRQAAARFGPEAFAERFLAACEDAVRRPAASRVTGGPGTLVRRRAASRTGRAGRA